MKETMVLYTIAATGHLMPMVALAKLFIRHGFSVTIVTFETPHMPGLAAREVARISSTNPSISFHVFPCISSDNNENFVGSDRMNAIVRGNNSKLLELLSLLSKTECVRAVVLDIFCAMALDVTNQLGISAYFFIAFGASDLAIFLRLLEIHETSTVSLKNMGIINFPGVPPLEVRDVPAILLDREAESYKGSIKILSSLIKGDGFLINSFESLEPRALVALREGHCLPNRRIPPIYCIGPLVNEGQEKKGEERHEALAWLDSQPKDSVVFLCFGSMGAFTPDQIKNIAIGLENNEQRFLWVIKVTDNVINNFEHKPNSDLGNILPEGFLDRTKNRGMVVNSWAPQVQILHHESVGGFVTHCGWNSVLETITAGVPVICWPLYAEQRLNKMILVEEIKIGAVMEGYDKETVEAKEVEKKVRLLMDSEEGKAIKERVVELKEKAKEALREDGSSSFAFLRFLEGLRAKNE